MKLLHSFIHKVLHNPLPSILGLLALKGIHFAILLYLTDCLSPNVHVSPLSIYAGDTFSYIGAMENFIKEGTYYFDHGANHVYAGRVPHYSIPYYVFRMAFDERTSMDLVVALQLMLEAISIYFLGLIIYRITRNVYAFAGVLLLALVASNATAMAFMLVPESFSCSLLIFVVYFYTVYREERKMRQLVALAVVLALLTTLKSYFVLLYAIVGWEIWAHGKYNMTAAIRPAIVLATPLMLFLAPWVIRNYRVEHTFIPLQVSVYAGYDYKNADLAFRRYLRAWGGDFILWEPKHAGCYFMPDPSIACTFTLPDYVFTTHYGAKEVEAVRQRFIQFHKQYTPAVDSALTREFDRMTQDYKSEKPFRFYVVSPLLLAKQFVIHSGSYYLPIYSNSPCYHPAQMVIKVSESLIYLVGIFVGIPGLALMSFRRKGVLFGMLPWILIILFPVALGFAEARYIRTVEPVLYLGVVYILVEVGKRVWGNGAVSVGRQ
jgi:hypothetical protein